MSGFDLAVKFVHVTSAIIAAGGVFFAWLALAPASAGKEEEFKPVYRRFGILFGVCLVLLLATGLYNILKIAPRMGPGYNMAFGMKFLLAIVYFGLAFALFHPAKAFARLQANRVTWLALLGIMGLGIIGFSVWMNSMRIWTLPVK